MTKPPLGITAKVDYLSNYDGDTIDFEFKQKIKLRVTDLLGEFDTPEMGWRAESNAEKYLADIATNRVREILSDVDEIHVHVPDMKPGELGTSFAVGTRIAGIVYYRVGNRWKCLSEILTNEELTKYFSNLLNDIEKTYLQGNFTVFEEIGKEEVYKELGFKVGQLKNDYRLRSLEKGGNFVNYMNERYSSSASSLVFVKGFEKNWLGIIK